MSAAFERSNAQSPVSVGAFLELARQRPDSPVLDAERSRAEALGDVLEQAAAHRDGPRSPGVLAAAAPRD